MKGKGVLTSFSTEKESLRTELSMALKGVREELDEHLDTINQATEEVQSNHEYLCRLEDKVDRLSEKVEQISILLRSDGKNIGEAVPENVELSDKEKEVFLVLYTESDRMLSYREIAEGVRESEFLVRGHVTSLIQKGIPIKKRYVNREAHVRLDSRFKELQAKTNLLKISQKTVKEFC